MKNRSNILLYAFSILLIFTSCTDHTKSEIVIRSCIDQDAAELEEAVSFVINGQSGTWIPGRDLVMHISIPEESGSISVQANSQNYRLNSPPRYEVDRSKGLELVLLFERKPEIVADHTDDLTREEPVDEPDEGVEEEEDPQEEIITFGSVSIQADPVNVSLRIQRSDIDFDTLLADIDQELITLATGTFNWTASAEDYVSQSGNFSISEDETTEMQIQLEEDIRYGTVYANILPDNAVVTITHPDIQESVRIQSGEQAELVVGSYSYSVTAPGYIMVESNITVSEDSERWISQNLSPVSVSQIISRIEDASSVGEYLNIFESIPIEQPRMSARLRSQYYDALIDLGMALFRTGEANRANNVFEIVLQQDESNYRARLQYISILNQQEDFREFNRIRRIIRPVYGTLLNVVPHDERAKIDFQARFLNAESFYNEFYSFDDLGRQRQIAAMALNALEEVVHRYNNRLNDSEKETFRSEYEKAKAYRDMIFRDLGI